MLARFGPLVQGALLLATLSCGDASVDPASPRDAGAVASDAGARPRGPRFAREVVAGLGSEATFGDHARLALAPDGRPVLAFGVIPASGGKAELHLAEREEGGWQSNLAVVPGAMTPMGGDIVGLGFAFVGGAPHLAYRGGGTGGHPNTLFPTDLMLAVRSSGAWSERALATTSADARGDCPGVQNYCNLGHVVGSHAALAVAPGGGGFAVVYRDTHFDFARDDLARSDVELYVEGGTFQRALVDAGRGGGTFADVAYLADGRLVVAYQIDEPAVNEDRVGVWAAVQEGSDGRTWRRRRVSPSRTSARVSLAVAPSGALLLAFYDADEADLVLASSSDDGETWTAEPVESVGKTGMHPSLVLGADGEPRIAYTYCGPPADRACPGRLGPMAQLRLATRAASGTWSFSVIDDDDGRGGVGFYTSAVTLPDGRLAVAYQDERGDLLYAEEER